MEGAEDRVQVCDRGGAVCVVEFDDVEVEVRISHRDHRELLGGCSKVDLLCALCGEN